MKSSLQSTNLFFCFSYRHHHNALHVRISRVLIQTNVSANTIALYAPLDTLISAVAKQNENAKRWWWRNETKQNETLRSSLQRVTIFQENFFSVKYLDFVRKWLLHFNRGPQISRARSVCVFVDRRHQVFAIFFPLFAYFPFDAKLSIFSVCVCVCFSKIDGLNCASKHQLKWRWRLEDGPERMERNIK